MRKTSQFRWLGFGVLVLGGALVWAQQDRKVGYSDTPFLPDGKWRVHDGTRPQPRVVDPGSATKAPSDAVVLFDGKDLSQWQRDRGGDAGWKVEHGFMEVVPGAGSVMTKAKFGDVQLHLEWATPKPAKGIDQGRGNSGVLFMDGRYEVQVLDSYENLTYSDGGAASLYGQYPPLVNASKAPGEWQTYDIMFTAPRFKDGKLEFPAYATVLHNGVLVHNHTAILGTMAHRAVPKYTPHEATGSLVLQNHGNPVRFRNIWYREIKAYDQP